MSLRGPARDGSGHRHDHLTQRGSRANSAHLVAAFMLARHSRDSLEGGAVPDSEDVQRLVAEAEIRRVVARYCRGIDRMDLELVRSCYHDDARDEHGSFSGSVDEYIDWVAPLLAKYDATMHFIGNQLVAFEDADTAWVETYAIAVHRSATDAPHLNLTTGVRFVDRFERRAGAWRIADRVAVADWSLRHAADDWWPVPEHHRQGLRDRDDVAYRGRVAPPDPG